MRTDLIDDFRLDLDDPAELTGVRCGTATLGTRKVSVAVHPSVPADPYFLRVYIEGAFHGRSRLWTDVAPLVKGYMEARATV
jgi:hypothetical protein